MQNPGSFAVQVLRTQARKVSERARAARAAFTFDPGPFAEHQFLRYVHYRRLAARIPQITRRETGARLVEFGGSNGAIRGMFGGLAYEVAPNFPTVDVQKLGRYADETYDVVVVDQVLEHVPDPQRAVTELRRVLKPGGVCIATTPFLIRVHGYPNDFHRFTAQGLVRLFADFSSCDADGWGNRYTLGVIERYGWLSAKNTKRLLHVALWNEPEWPINFLTVAFK